VYLTDRLAAHFGSTYPGVIARHASLNNA